MPKGASSIKMGEAIFVRCPVSTITDKTWQILRIINNTTDSDCNITIPYRGHSYTDQPEWYKQALGIVRAARFKHRENRIKNG